MALENLKYLSEKEHENLLNQYQDNKDKYLNGDFKEFINSYGWNMEIKDIQVDFQYFKHLDASSDSSELDVENSLTVWRALRNISPTVATDSRVWTRISHSEGFEFTRKRWLLLRTFKTDKEVNTSIRKHFFATGRTQYRDDNAIARLWWSAWIAHQVNPDNPRFVLETLFNRADTRSNIIERPGIATRSKLVKPLIEVIDQHWPLNEREVREFMIAVNLYGGGIVFEALSDSDINNFLEKCLAIGRKKASEKKTKNKK
ncbi:DUF6339 family protein [Photobacterium phosphoreum]|uniref:DUF6339 family protein n=1 Tax=Photobacterium phosphoreum TaxID=659 RepID=UPI001E509689|nr:DUF6339 family protein [Photobacterium phosphoreum]MCD9505483.1 hypothetical protein [Photobacterium phosphoreum]